MLSTTAPEITSQIDPRFGRGAYLLVVDTETGTVQGHPNPGAESSGGAGVQAAQFASTQEVQAVISGDFGPNAFDSLKAAGIAIYFYGDCQTAAEAIERFKAGSLPMVGAPANNSHSG